MKIDCFRSVAEPKPGQWDIDVDEASSGKERATVALVSEQVKGVERLIHAGFKDVQRQLDAVSGLPARVTALEVDLANIKAAVTKNDQRKYDTKSWKRGLVASGVLLLMGTLVNLAISGHIF